MTAIVGTINRRGVAFAADSAATHTVSSKHKITNNANKIFELSKHHPVGVCICGNLDFLGMPWEDVFKMYRNSLKETGYECLKDYSTHFFKFVKQEIMTKLVSDQKVNLSIVVNGYLNELISISKQELEKEDNEETDINLLTKLESKMSMFLNIYTNKEKCSDFEEYSLSDFSSYSCNIVNSLLTPFLSLSSNPDGFRDLFISSLFSIIVSTVHVYLNKTELIFWGYGNGEIFPSYYSFEVSSAFDSLIKYSLKSKYIVSNIDNACVEPFAQTDVANTVIRGIDDDLRMRFYDSYKSSITVFRDEMISSLTDAGAPKGLVEAINNMDIDTYTKTFADGMNQYIQENYIEKLVNTVSYLSKEDLADMAESLVRMTYLKRRITSEEESVGGAVDVAVITKGDGFVWLKRKHYFDAKLNPHYFERSKD